MESHILEISQLYEHNDKCKDTNDIGSASDTVIHNDDGLNTQQCAGKLQDIDDAYQFDYSLDSNLYSRMNSNRDLHCTKCD